MPQLPSISSLSSSSWTNPFSTSQIRPGAIEYIFPAECSEDEFWQRFLLLRRRGQIIGPHGSGKSTLIRWLVARLVQRGFEVRLMRLGRDARRLAVNAAEISKWGRNTQVIVDGYEQLCWRWRAYLRWQTWRRRCGLVISAHRGARLPTLYRTYVTPELASRIVVRLMSEHPHREIILQSLCFESGRTGRQMLSRQAVETQLSRHNGDMRETLFSLYDACEKLRPIRQPRGLVSGRNN